MKISDSTWGLLGGVALLIACAFVARAAKADKPGPDAHEQEREVKENEVPAAALKALKQQAAGARITEYSEEFEHGQKFYEGTFKSVSGSSVDVLVTESGDLVEIEESSGPNQVPAAVLDSARKAAGGGELSFEKKTAVTYEIHFMRDGREHELQFTPDGRAVAHDSSHGADPATNSK